MREAEQEIRADVKTYNAEGIMWNNKDFDTWWSRRAEFTKRHILYKWFEGKTLQQVIRKAKELGHFRFKGDNLFIGNLR